MLTLEEEIHQTLSQLNEPLSEMEQNLDEILQDCNAKGAKALHILAEVAAELKANQQELKEELNELLKPVCKSGDGNTQNPDLSLVQDELLRLAGIKGSEGLLLDAFEGLFDLKKRVDELNDRVTELMTDYNIVPKFRRVKESYNKNEPLDSKKKSEGLKENLESGDFNLCKVALYTYGFPLEVAADIEASIGHRRLVKSERLFLADEGETGLDVDSDHNGERRLEKDSRELIWIRIKNLKEKFEQLKKIIYLNKELDLNAEPEVLSGSAGEPVAVNLKVTFMPVLRNWIFRIEDVLVGLMYEIYHMFSGNEAAFTIFLDLKSELKRMREFYFGMVPISVYKIIYMIENPIGLEMTRMGTVSDKERLHEEMKLNDMINVVQEIIMDLRSVLVTADLFYARLIKEDESASYEKILTRCEEELRDMERTINRTKSELKEK